MVDDPQTTPPAADGGARPRVGAKARRVPDPVMHAAAGAHAEEPAGTHTEASAQPPEPTNVAVDPTGALSAGTDAGASSQPQAPANTAVDGEVDPHSAADAEDVPEAYARFDRFPGYVQLQRRMAVAHRLGLPVPFFTPHHGVAGARTVVAGRTCINFSSYNYLGLCGHAAVSAAAHAAIDTYGTSVSASRLVAGERPLHQELEAALAAQIGAPAALALVSGHATNVTTIGQLFGARDLVLTDAAVHNSVRQGAQLSGAHWLTFPHNDWQALDDLLRRERRRHERALVAIEAVYSMDGDIADLPRFIEVKKRHRAFLMVDEAHSLGVIGATGGGAGEHFSVPRDDVDIWMGTLSKTFASCGGFIAGCEALIYYLRYAAPGFVFSVGMSPPDAAAALAALRQMQAEPERVARLQARSRLFLDLARQRGLDTGRSGGSAIVPVIVRNSMKTLALAQQLLESGLHVSPILHPGVTEREARLRFFLSCDHSEDDIRTAVQTTADLLARL